MRSMTVFSVSILSVVIGCAEIPKNDPLWDATLLRRTLKADDGGGNCEEVAWELRRRYGGSVVHLAHPRRRNQHAIVLFSNNTVLDNGFLGYQTTWKEVKKDGWKIVEWPTKEK